MARIFDGEKDEWEDTVLLVQGGQFGLRLKDRGENDPHACIELLSEDDEVWHVKASFSSFWLQDLALVVKAAQDKLRERYHPDPTGYGYLNREKI